MNIIIYRMIPNVSPENVFIFSSSRSKKVRPVVPALQNRYALFNIWTSPKYSISHTYACDNLHSKYLQQKNGRKTFPISAANIEI